MPNLLVYIDRRDGAPTTSSLFALSEARRIAHGAGLTVFALVFDAPPEGGGGARSDAMTGELGRAGADRVLLCEGKGLGGTPLDVSHGRALYTATERVPPIIVLFPSGGPGEELGPPLAARLGAAYASSVDIQISEESGPLAAGVGRINLRRWRADRAGYRHLDPVDIERPIVAVLGMHGSPREEGTPDIDLEVIACVPPPDVPLVELGSEPDDQEPVVQARGLVVVAPGVAPEVVARLREAAPPGVVVVDATGDVAASALAAASPEFLLDLGGAPLAAEVGVSPRARLGLARIVTTPDGRAAPAGGRHPADLMWDMEAPQALAELAAAMGSAR